LYHYGQILLVTDVLDPHGRNPKTRPIIVVTPDDVILEGGDLFGVAVTGTFPDPLPVDAVKLPWHRDGHPKTGLDKPAVAACHWIVPIDPDRVVRPRGFVPAKQIWAIAEILNRTASD
jgi:mRNA-degrading endonuclease toxin of MazEF toxin-antitoxin module